MPAICPPVVRRNSLRMTTSALCSSRHRPISGMRRGPPPWRRFHAKSLGTGSLPSRIRRGRGGATLPYRHGRARGKTRGGGGQDPPGEFRGSGGGGAAGGEGGHEPPGAAPVRRRGGGHRHVG